jgi:hypothetical protein
VPAESVATYAPRRWEIGIVVGVNLALVLATWIMTKKYTESLMEQAARTNDVPDLGEVGSH